MFLEYVYHRVTSLRYLNKADGLMPGGTGRVVGVWRAFASFGDYISRSVGSSGHEIPGP